MNQILRCDWRCDWTTCRVPQEKFPRKSYNKYFIDQTCSVKMAGYWPCSFFARLWTSTPSRSINTQEKNLANIQPSWPYAWSITHTSITSLPTFVIDVHNPKTYRRLVDAVMPFSLEQMGFYWFLFQFAQRKLVHFFVLNVAYIVSCCCCCCFYFFAPIDAHTL